jgi:K+-sensing histidine kinase KdpD
MIVSNVRDWIKGRSLRTKLLAAIVLTEGAVFGVIAVILSRQSAFGGSVVILVGLFLASICVLTVFIRSGLLRLTRLTDQIQHQVTSGELMPSLSVERDDEIGRLAAAFNQLSAADRQALEHLHSRADDLAMLNMLAATISQTLDLQQVLDISLQQALNTINWDAGAIYLWDDRADIFNMVSYVDLPEDYIREVFSYRAGEGIIGRAAEKGQIIIAEGDVDDVPVSSGLAAQISIPLRVPGRLLGVMNLGSKSWRRPSPSQHELLTTIGHQIAVALEKAQLHHDLAKHAEELEGMVEARTEALAQAIDELSDALDRAKEADKVKSQLLSTVSHELRTPLATIKGHTSVLVDHYQSVSRGMLHESLIDIEEEADKLTELISSLLEMSRIEAGVLHIQPQAIDLSDVVRSTVEAAQVRVTSHPIRFETPEGRLSSFADARRVQQILDNLLDNAAKYSEPGKPIVVTVKARNLGPVISVKDEGYGIPGDRLDKIFDRFYQIKAGDDRTRGIGLGLAICHGLVEAHTGRIWVTSEVGKGSIFSFSLPSDEHGARREVQMKKRERA